MFKIISPDQYQIIAWKIGKGVTTELAINSGGTLNNFDWRLSIASVVGNGAFSHFSGYHRQLILLRGKLIQGPIQDFNVMTKQNVFKADVKTFPQ